MGRDALIEALQKTHDVIFRHGFYSEEEWPVLHALQQLIQNLKELE